MEIKMPSKGLLQENAVLWTIFALLIMITKGAIQEGNYPALILTVVAWVMLLILKSHIEDKNIREMYKELKESEEYQELSEQAKEEILEYVISNTPDDNEIEKYIEDEFEDSTNETTN